jgi:hypothetical protein
MSPQAFSAWKRQRIFAAKSIARKALRVFFTAAVLKKC